MRKNFENAIVVVAKKVMGIKVNKNVTVDEFWNKNVGTKGNVEIGVDENGNKWRLEYDGWYVSDESKGNFGVNLSLSVKGYGNGCYNKIIKCQAKTDVEIVACGGYLLNAINAIENAIKDALDVVIKNTINDYNRENMPFLKEFFYTIVENQIYTMSLFYGIESVSVYESMFNGDINVDNSEDLNSPDALDNDEDYGFIGLEDASEVCDGNMMACVDKYGQEFIDRVLNEYADVVYNAVSDYDLNDTITYCVKDALKDMEYDPKKKRLVGCSDVTGMEWDDEEEFGGYFVDAYGFDEDSCLEFYEKYCDDIWHFSDEYDEQMEDALRYFDEDSVFDKMFYKVFYNKEGYINVYIDIDDFVNYIKKNIVFNDSKAQLFKYEDLGLRLYYYLDPDNEDIEQFYKDLVEMTPMVTDVKLYDDGLYFWYNDMTDMTIREFYELYKKKYGDVEEPINCYIDKFMSHDFVEMFKNLVEKLEDGVFYLSEDGDGDLFVAGNEDFCRTYFNDDVTMTKVYVSLMNSMNEEIAKIENEIEKEIEEETKYRVLAAFECESRSESDFDVDYNKWWDWILGETPDWIKDKYFDKFCDVSYDYFVKFAKDYNYVVEKVDGGISLEKSDNN